MPPKGCVILIDPKGDRRLFARTAAEAERHHKPFAMFLTAFPQYSASFNPLASAETSLEIAARIKALTPETRDPFFTGFSLAFVTRIAEAQQKLRRPWTLIGLYEASVIRRHMEVLIEQYLVSLGCYRTPKRGQSPLDAAIAEYEQQGLHDATADALINYARWPREHYQKVTATLIPTFDGVVNGAFAHLLSPAQADLTWGRIIREGMVVYIGLSSLMFPETANRIARTFVQDLLGFLGRRYAYEEPAQMSRITVFIDEFGDVVYPGIVEAIGKPRGANVSFILAKQSRADAEAKLGEADARRVFENLGTTCYFRLADQKTAETVFKGLTYRVDLPQPPSVGLGYGGVGGLSGRTQAGLTSYEVPAVRPSWLTALPIGEGFCLKGGILWKFLVPLLEPVPQETLERLGLAAMWRAMDPNYVYEGELCSDPLPKPTVPPARWLSAPSLPRLPSPAAMQLGAGSMKANSSSFRRVLQRILRRWQHWGSRPV